MEKRNFDEVSISLGYTALVNLSRFFERGIYCAKFHDPKISCSREHTALPRQILKQAREKMRILKAKGRLDKTDLSST